MQNDPLIGQQLGAYHIQSKLGEGGMARVYKAYHARLRRDVAIKVILAQIAGQQGFKERFEREAQLIASLQHPNIVAVYDFGDIGDLTYLVMQYVGGGTLRDQLRGGHALDPRLAILYCQQMARALHHAHLRGIVHRDVKPQNMLVSATDANQLLLSDFGIAKLFDSRHEPAMPNLSGSTLASDPSLTNVDQIVGTAEYMSPEQVTGKPVDARTDVYALGVVLYQALTGEVPFRSTTVQGLLYQHVYTPPTPLREINPYVPEILEQITSKALAKAPEDRFQSAEAMAQALETANIHITNRLSSSLPGSLGQYSSSPLTPPSQNRPSGAPPSYYGPQSPAVHPGATANPQQPSAYGATPPYGSPARITNPSGAGLARPALPSRVHRAPVAYIGTALVLLLAIGLILVKQGIIPWFNSNPNNLSTIAQPFTETFQNNDRNWPQLNSNGLNAAIASDGYHLAISSSLKETYFPHPDVGTLPANFTLTVQFKQTQGASLNLFGLAFQEKDDGNGGNVTGYAFVINYYGISNVLKYDPNTPGKYTTLDGPINPPPGFQTGLNTLHTLQAIVQGSKFFFKVDGQQVPGTAPDHSVTDPAYTGGQLTLYVSGTNATFIVTSVQLAIP
jgi:serine/threonine protein kinase